MEEIDRNRESHQEKISRIIHDLRGPLNVILMSAEMLERKPEPTIEFVKRHTEKIKENAFKMNEIIEQLRKL